MWTLRTSDAVLNELIGILLFGLISIILLRLSMVINDWIILYKFKITHEITKEKNVGTGYVVGGMCIATGLMLSGVLSGESEGISKLIEVNVLNAKNKTQASNVAFSIAESILVKTAIAGEDANWGRVVMAIGKGDKYVDQNKITIKFDDMIVAKKGKMYPKINIKKLNNYMKNKIIIININLGIGKFRKKVFSSDLTHEYIKINKDYRS